jgi:hypothetical protein
LREPMSMVCADVSNQPHSALHQKISEFPTFVTYDIYKLKTTVDTRLVDWCSDIIRIYS